MARTADGPHPLARTLVGGTGAAPDFVIHLMLRHPSALTLVREGVGTVVVVAVVGFYEYIVLPILKAKVGLVGRSSSSSTPFICCCVIERGCEKAGRDV